MPDTLDYLPADVTHPEVRLLLAALDQATDEWLSQVDDDVTDDELRWQAFPDGHSIAAILAHIAEVEHYWLHHIAAGEPLGDRTQEIIGGRVDQMGVRWPTAPPNRPLSYYMDWLRTTRERSRELLRDANDPDRLITVTRRRDGSVHTFTLRWVLTHTILHEAYHGGQAALLLLEQRQRA